MRVFICLEVTIQFSIPCAGKVSRGTYSLHDTLITQPVNGYYKNGLYSLRIPGLLSKGIYPEK